MELSSKVYHINAGIQQQFIFKLAIVKNLNQFNMRIELYQLNVQDETTLQIVLDHVAKFCNDPTLLRKIDNKLIDSVHLNYYEIESYLPVLKADLLAFTQNSTNDNNLFNFRICNKFDVIFNILQVRRLYSDLYGFYQNHMILDALYKLTLANVDVKPDIVNIAKHKDALKKENQKEQLPPVIISTYTEENTKFDNLLTLCISPSMKSFIINLSCNYYVYVGRNDCFVDRTSEEGQFKIQAVSLFSSNYIFNSDFIKSLIMSLVTYDSSEIQMRLTKLFNCLLVEDNTPIETMAILAMIYLYFLVYLTNSHSSYLLSNINELFTDTTIQSRLFNNHCKLYMKRNDITLFLKDADVNELGQRSEDSQINLHSKKYEHLAGIDETSFIDKILNDLNPETKSDQIILNSKRIINMNNLKSLKSAEAKKESQIKENILIDSNNELDFDQHYLNLFCYDFDNPYLTLAHEYFNDFIKDQSDFLLRYKQKKINTKLVDVSVINLFGIIKTILYDQKSEIYNGGGGNNTFSFYKSIIKSINDPSVFSHNTFLTIIYQIFIPFFYVNHNIIEFESTF